MINIELIIIATLGFPAIVNTLLKISIPFIYYIFLYAISLLIIIFIKKPKLKINNFFTYLKENKFLLILITILIISRFLPILKFNVSPLHDPLTHAYFAKTISESGMVNFSYSPLLHSIVGLINQIIKVPIPKLILLINSLFMVLIPINTYFLIKKIYSNKIFAYLGFIAISIAPSPNNLFFTAGKNAFIFALLISIISFYFLFLFFKKLEIKNLIKLVISLILLFFCHYPTFIIILIITFSYFLLNSKQIFLNKRLLIITIVSLLLSSLIIGYWYTAKLNNKLVNLSDLSSKNQSSLSTTNKINTITINTENSLKEISNNSKINFSTFSLILFVFLVLIKNEKKVKRQFNIIYSFLILLLLLLFVISVNTLSNMFIIYETFLLFIVPLIYVAIALSISSIINKKLFNKNINIFLLIILLIYCFKQIEIGINYRKTEYDLNSVSQYDLEAFNFIKNNLNNKFIILSANQLKQMGIQQVVFVLDSSGWIPIYTNSNIATPFWEFGSNKSIEFSKITENIIKNNKDDNNSINQLKEMKVKYIYLDKGIFGEGLILSDFNKIKYKSIFKNNEVEIIELL